MPTREYRLPDGSKLRHSDGGRVEDKGSFPRRWLDHQDQATLDDWGITVEDVPDPVPPKPTLDDIKRRAKGDASRLALNSLVKATVAQAELDIDAAADALAVHAVLDALR